MAKEYLGIEGINDLFDIIDEHYVSKKMLATRERKIANAISVGSALIAASLLKVAEAIAAVKGGEGGGNETCTDDDIDVIIYDGGDIDIGELITICDGGDIVSGIITDNDTPAIDCGNIDDTTTP